VENVIVIVNSADIPAAESIAAGLSDYKIYFFDPTLSDKILESKLAHASLVAWQNCPEYPELTKWAHSTAFELERELDAAAQKIVPEVSLLSWQHLSLYYFLLSVRWYEGLWREALLHTADTKFFVIVCDNPAYYYLPSFIPAMLLLRNLMSNGAEFSAFTCGGRADDTDVVPDLAGVNPESDIADILVHIPTTFYDRNYFSAELQASGKRVIALQSKYWHASIDASTQVGLSSVERQVAGLPESCREKITAFASCLEGKLDTLLARYLALPAYRSRQCRHLANVYKSQLVTYYLLEEYFRQRAPAKILLSEHDAGFHGPIFSFADRHHIPVLIVPHSKVCADIEFDGRNAVSLTHPIQGECISDRNGKRVLNFNLAFPEKFAGSTLFPERITRVGLILNGLTLNGILITRYAAYMEGIRQISEWCAKNGVELSIRCRPGMTMYHDLEQATGIGRDALEDALRVPMAQFAESCDLHLMYDTPTTGALHFLQNSIPILNPVPDDLSWSEACIANAKVVPRGSVTATLNTLDSFLSDTTNYFLFRNVQFKEYVSLFTGAYPLRHFL